MQVYLGIKFHPDNRNCPTIEGITQALNANNIDCICVRRDVEQWGAVEMDSPQLLMQKTFAIIRKADFTIIELSEKGVGLGIEAGYAHAIGKPVFTLAKAGSDISETLVGISTDIFLYEELKDLNIYFAGKAFKG